MYLLCIITDAMSTAHHQPYAWSSRVVCVFSVAAFVYYLVGQDLVKLMCGGDLRYLNIYIANIWKQINRTEIAHLNVHRPLNISTARSSCIRFTILLYVLPYGSSFWNNDDDRSKRWCRAISRHAFMCGWCMRCCTVQHTNAIRDFGVNDVWAADIHDTQHTHHHTYAQGGWGGLVGISKCATRLGGLGFHARFNGLRASALLSRARFVCFPIQLNKF